MVETRSSKRRSQHSAEQVAHRPQANISRKRKPLDPPPAAHADASAQPAAKRQKNQQKTDDEAESSPDAPVIINRSPVLQLWGACVAQKLHPDLSWQTCLSAGSAIATLCAISKGKSVGVIEEKDKSEKKGKKKVTDGESFDEVDVMHFKLKVKDGLVYVGSDPKAKSAPEELLKKKFGDRYGDVKRVFQDALEDWSVNDFDELNKDAFHMYEQFRPTVKSGQSGWGRKGELNLQTVEEVIAKTS